MAIELPGKKIPLGSLSLSIEDVKKIFAKLLAYVHEQRDREVDAFVKPVGQADAEFEAFKEKVRTEAFRITVTIEGADGTSLYGDDVELFDSPNLPDFISAIFMTNKTAYEGLSRTPPSNSFVLLLDFSKPPLLDSKNPVSNPTPNRSDLTINGDRGSWVAGISDAVTGVLDGRRNRRGWLHRAFIYDFGVMLFGFPFGLYVCWKLAAHVENYLGSIHSFLSAAAYIYLFLLVVWAYRIFFGYTKWAFPSVELEENKDLSRRHRGIWSAILLALVVNIIWEILS